MKIRILDGLRTWIKNYMESIKREETILMALQTFANTGKGATKEEESVFSFLRAVLSVVALTPRDVKRKSSTRVLSTVSIEVANLEILDIEPQILAEQISLIDHDLFKAIAPHEFLQCNFNHSSQSPGFAAMVGKFNEWTSWVATEVMKQERPSGRASLITHFIKVAEVTKVT
jgi:hypothetical protein